MEMANQQHTVIFRTGLVGFLLVAALFLVPPLFKQQQGHKKAMENLETVCWMPAHFEESMEKYANAFCQDKIRKNSTYPVIDTIPPSRESYYNKSITPTEKIFDKVQGRMTSPQCHMTIVLFMELLVVFVFYALTEFCEEQPTSKHGKMEDECDIRVMSESCNKMHVLAYVMVITCFLALAVAPHKGITDALDTTPPQYQSGVTLCDFKVRKLGNIQRYTVQCFYSYETPTKYNQRDVTNIHDTLMMNSLVCAILILLALACLIKTCINIRK